MSAELISRPHPVAEEKERTMITKFRTACISLLAAALPIAIVLANTASHASQQAGYKLP